MFLPKRLVFILSTRNLALNGDILWKRSLLKGAAVKTQYARRSEATAADSLLPSAPAERKLVVNREPAWWIAAVLLGGFYIAVLGRGIQLPH